MQDRLVDPLRVATHLLCTAANCLPVRTIGTGRPGATAPDGRTAVGWRIRSRYGHQIVYMLDDVAFLCDVYLSDGRKLTHELSKELGGLVRARDPNASKLLSSELEKEAARVPASDAIEAIEMAKQLPVVAAAELFHQKLDDTGAIVNLFAARKTASGDWIWALKTEKSLFPFTFTGEEWVMFDHALKPMAKLSKTDVESAAT